MTGPAAAKVRSSLPFAEYTRSPPPASPTSIRPPLDANATTDTGAGRTKHAALVVRHERLAEHSFRASPRIASGSGDRIGERTLRVGRLLEEGSRLEGMCPRQASRTARM